MPNFNDPAYGWGQPNYNVGQLGGILGNVGQGGGGILGGTMRNLSDFWNSDAVLPAAAALIGGPTLRQGLAGAFAQAGPGLVASKKRMAINDWLKAGAPKAVQHPAVIKLFDAAPDIAEKVVGAQFVQSPQDLTAEQKNYRAGLNDPAFKDYQTHMRPGIDPENPLAVRRWTLSANAAVRPYTELSAYKLVQNAAPYLSRIEAVAGAPGSISDQELLDSVVKLNTGGNQVTEAQVNIALKGKSFADQVNVWSNYMTANGGVLSDDQRKQLQDVAHAVYRGYQKMYQPIYDAATKALKDRNIPEAYWSAIPDLNSLSSAAGIDMATGMPTAGGEAAPTAVPSGGVVPYTEYFK